MPRTALSRSTALAVGLAALLALTGCGVDVTAPRAAAAEPPAVAVTATPTATPTSTPSPMAAPTAAPTAKPTPTTSPTAKPTPTANPTPTKPAVDVAAVQRRLRELRYYAGPVDGSSGSATRSAVMAFQKVNRLTADGAVGPRTLAALQAPRAPRLRYRTPADRVEVDLDLQVLHVVEDGRIVRTLPVSPGNGQRYREADGTWARALTPVGTYRIGRRIVGERTAQLGTLYDPQYFHRGWAIHGSNSVPAGPASHGCVRVTRADAKALLRLLGVGTTVHLYGGTHVFWADSSVAGTSAPAA